MRNPIETIASRMSLLQSLWRHRNPNFGNISPNHVRWILQNSISVYQQTEQGLRDIPADRKMIIGYNELKSSPQKTLKKITEHFHFPSISTTLMNELNKTEDHPYHSKHLYDVQQFGITEDEIQTPLSTIFKKYQHLFFDLDRTLWDFERNSAEAIEAPCIPSRPVFEPT